MFVVDAELEGRPARVAVEPKSALNLVGRDAARRLGLALEPAPAVRVEREDGATPGLAERARARLRLAGRELDVQLYVADWPLPGDADALLGAPTLHRHGLELDKDQRSFREPA